MNKCYSKLNTKRFTILFICLVSFITLFPKEYIEAARTHVHSQSEECKWTGATVVTHQSCSYCGDSLGVILNTQTIAIGKTASTSVGSNKVCSVCGKTNTITSSKRKYQFTYSYTCGATQVVDGTSRTTNTSYMYPAGAHVHTDACYRGTKHVHTDSCYTEEEYTREEWFDDYYVDEWVEHVDADGDGFYEDHIFGGGYWEGHWEMVTGTETVLTCSKSTSDYYFNGVKETAFCSQVVTNLVPTLSSQTIIAGQSPVATATATFLDGSSEVVTCTLNNYNPLIYNTPQTVTYSYGSYSGTSKNATPKTATATITITGNYYLNIFSEDVSKGTVAGTPGYYSIGSYINVSAIANRGYQFNGWYEGSTNVSNNATYSFYMLARDLQLTATFKPIDYQLNVTIDAAKHGTVSVLGGSGLKSYKTTVTVSATNKEGFTFEGWYNGTKVSSNPTYTFQMPYNDLTLEARYTTNYYSLNTFTNQPERGGVVVIGGSGNYLYESTVSVKATNYIGYTFEGWYEGETKVSSDAIYTFIMPYKNLYLEARFKVNSYNLDVTTPIPERGTVEVIGGSGQYLYLSDVTVKAVNEIGYTFEGWYNGETKVSSDATYTFTMPYNDLTLEARFTINSYNLDVSIYQPERGNVEVLGGSGEYLYKTEVTVKATSNTSYVFEGWYDNDVKVSNDEIYTFSMPARNLTLQAKFKQFIGASVEFTQKFYDTYAKEPYFNGAGYDIAYDIILDKSMVNVYSYFDMGDRVLVSENQFSFINNKIYKVGINKIKVEVTINNLSLIGDGVEVIGYYNDLSDVLDTIMTDMGVEPGDYVGLKNAINGMNLDLELYRKTIDDIKSKLSIDIEAGTDQSTLKSELSIVNNEIIDLYNRYLSLESALDTAFENYDIDLTSATEIKNTIILFKTTLTEIDQEVTILRTKIEAIELTISEKEQLIIEKQNSLVTLKDDNEVLINEILELETTFDMLTNTHQLKVDNLTSLNEIIESNETLIKVLREEIATQIINEETNGTSLDAIKKRLIEQEQEQEVLQNRILQLQEEYNIALSLNNQLQYEINGLEQNQLLANPDFINMTKVETTQQSVMVTKETADDLTLLLLKLEDANKKLSSSNSISILQ